MVIFLTGASGFIGRHLVQALARSGHEVVCASREPVDVPGCTRHVQVDFTRDLDPEDWVGRLRGVDAVVNAIGILREHGAQTFESIHVLAPRALFTACVAAGVRRVVQISALGADEGARSRYHVSKRRADEHLSGLPLDWTIVQPSLVYGPEGTSARLFTFLASLPWIPVPGRGDQLVQPVHIDDLVDGIVALLPSRTAVRARVPVVGPAPIFYRDMLQALRLGMGLPRGRFLHVPIALLRALSPLSRFSRDGLPDSETLEMLLRGNTADAGPFRELLGREPRSVRDFISAAQAAPLRTATRLRWLLPPLRWSIGIVWIVSGVLSLGVYPVEQSHALLARVGATGTFATLLLYGAAAVDLVFGLATFLLRNRRLLWLAQMTVILVYTVLVTVRLPEFWLHPFGPILKNLPLLAAIWLLYQLEKR